MQENKLKKVLNTEDVYKGLIENMAEAVWVGDENERTVYANPRFAEMLGYTLDEMIGEESYIFWDEESTEKVKYINQNHRKKGISSSYEGNLKTKSGELIPVFLNGTPLPDGGTVGIMTDMTELKKKESMYQTLIENMKEGVWVGDENERTVYANPEFCKLTGYELEELIDINPEFIWEKKTAQKVRSINEQERKHGISSIYEGIVLNKKGEEIPVIVSGSPSPEGGTIGILTDLSQIKEKEETERILNSAIKYASDAIIVFNPDGKITSWNKGAKMVFGYKEEEIIGQNLNTLFHDYDAKEMTAPESVLYNLEIDAFHNNGETIKVSATLTPIFDENGNKSDHHLIICRDITNQAKYEEELTIKYEKIKDAYNQFGILRRQNDYIFDLLELANERSDRQSLADFIVSSIIMLTKVDACVLRTFDKDTKKLELVSSFGVGQDWQGKKTAKYKDSLYEKAFTERKALKIIDVGKEPKYESKSLAKKNNLCSLMLIPLVFKDELVGTLSLYTNPNRKLEIFENEFIEKYARVIELVMSQF